MSLSLVSVVSRVKRHMLVALLTLSVVMAMSISVVAQSPEPQPAGGSGDEATYRVFLPSISVTVVNGDPSEIATSEELQTAAAAKFNAIPVSESWFKGQQQWFEQFMEQQQLQSASLGELSVDDLNELASVPQSPELDAFLTLVSNENGLSAASSNNLDMTKARNGDILLGYSKWISLWGIWRHAAIWDNGQILHSPGKDRNDSNNEKVKNDRGDYFRDNFTLAAIMGVFWSSDSLRKDALSYAKQQFGEPYSIWTDKMNEAKWYCSKLPWAGYYRKSPWWLRVDLDPSGGFWATPDDLWWSGWTYLRSFGR